MVMSEGVILLSRGIVGRGMENGWGRDGDEDEDEDDVVMLLLPVLSLFPVDDDFTSDVAAAAASIARFPASCCFFPGCQPG